MHDQARRRLALRNGHLQGRAHQFGRHVRRHGPADNLARVQIQHRRQVQPATARADVGDVRDPGCIGSGRSEVPVQNIVGNGQAVAAVGGVNEFAPPHRT